MEPEREAESEGKLLNCVLRFGLAKWILPRNRGVDFLKSYKYYEPDIRFDIVFAFKQYWSPIVTYSEAI